MSAGKVSITLWRSSESRAMTKEQRVRKSSADPCLFVIIGARGDLTRRKLLPALYQLMDDAQLAARQMAARCDRAQISRCGFAHALLLGHGPDPLDRQSVIDTLPASSAMQWIVKTIPPPAASPAYRGRRSRVADHVRQASLLQWIAAAARSSTRRTLPPRSGGGACC